ncbi:nitroreductase family deazaflavin-dependent oxidoreductase [Mycobacteroides chelonae]|uniref:nitroreductase family deazaflavin-dependent oxidoreductase n=1 Tax=Mycobacteroides chelonae TaxID=1774 RepID=UPI001910FF5C|nr:nitroreductase family deazaflavin-dependent oxidoreductase [Mycobacteroides chelonae]QQG96047.1 nitroreductase family deazaflavin-dependent oxidoreductase [Mycobacteroides chelonae]
MPLHLQAPRWLAHFNKRVTNRIQGKWAGTVPPYGVILHRGRKSGTIYRTPVVLLRARTGFAVMAGYGRHSDWIKNLEAAGTVDIQRRGETSTFNQILVASAPEALRHLRPIGRWVTRCLKPEWVVLMLEIEVA